MCISATHSFVVISTGAPQYVNFSLVVECAFQLLIPQYVNFSLVVECAFQLLIP